MDRRWVVIEQHLQTGEVREFSRHWRERRAHAVASTLNDRVQQAAGRIGALPDTRYNVRYHVRSARQIEETGTRG